jgi:uncharacterized membrane protein YdjX (TVP38/TMEM64 family)
MQNTLPGLIAVAAGLATTYLARGVLDSRAITIGIGFIVAYVIWGELSDRFSSATRPRLAPGTPLLQNPSARRRIFAVFALAAATSLALTDLFVGDVSADDARRWMDGLGFWGPLLLITILAAAMVFAPIPNPPFMIAAGIIWGTSLGVAYALIGQLIGSALIFFISRKAGRRFIPRLVGQEGAARIDKLSLEMGPQVVFWWRMMPISFDFAAYAAGLTTMSFRLFITLVFFGSILPTTLIVGFGDALTASWTARFLMGGLILAGISIPLTVFYLRYRDTVPFGEWLRVLTGEGEPLIEPDRLPAD